MTKKLALLLFIGLLNLTGLVSQNDVIEAPVYIGLFYHDPIIGIPNKPSNNYLKLATRRNVGIFKNISTTWLDFEINSNLKKGGNNTFGVILYDDKEGDFIKRNRFYLKYIRHQKINQKLTLASQVTFGGYIFSIKSNNITGSIGEPAIDGNVGLGMYTKLSTIGISVNQFPNSTVQPVNQTILLKRHFNVYASQRFNLLDSLYIISRGNIYLIKNSENEFKNFVSISASINYKILGAGITYNHITGNYFSLSINKLKTKGTASINVELAYFAPNNKSFAKNTNTIELALGYNFANKFNK